MNPQQQNQPPWLPATVCAILMVLPACAAAGSIDMVFVLNSLILLLGAQISRPPR